MKLITGYEIIAVARFHSAELTKLGNLSMGTMYSFDSFRSGSKVKSA